jgi:hypothetical protein
MDLNYLFHRHQVSLMRADAAVCVESRHAHRALARGYAHEIARIQEDAGASAFSQGAI